MLGKPVPDFSAPSTGNTTFKLSGTRGSKVVLYFYPKDNTPGCTQQGPISGTQYKEFSQSRDARSMASRATPSSRTKASRPR